jgi:hypothetical protein
VFTATRRIAAPKDRLATVPASGGFGLSIGRTGANFKYFLHPCDDGKHIFEFGQCQGLPEGGAATGRLEQERESSPDRLAFIHVYDRSVSQDDTYPALRKFDNILISQD